MNLFCGVAAASLSGLLAGYHLGIISGTLISISEEFQLSLFDQQGCVTILLIGALIGSLVTGVLMRRIGRKNMLFFLLFLFGGGMLLLAETCSYLSLLIGRFIIGFAVGFSFVVPPVYIAEISPTKWRGALVFCNSLAITIGIFISYLIAYTFAPCYQWREMFSLISPFLIVQFFLLLAAPKGYPLSGGHSIPSSVINLEFKKPHSDLFWNNPSSATLQEYSYSLDHSNLDHSKPFKFQMHDQVWYSNWRAILTPSLRKPLMIGIVLSAIQQLSGINAVIFYAPHIFQQAGYHSIKMALWGTAWMGGVNVLATLIGLWLVDHLGRRTLLMVGLAGMTGSLLVLAFFQVAISLFVYIASFAISLGPIVWLLLTELYPAEIRAEAMGVSAFINWLCNILVALTFLSLVHVFGSTAVFFLYALVSFVSFWFVHKQVPETKGKSFEEIQLLWK